MDHDIDNYYKTAEKLCKEAGETIREAFYLEKNVETKSSVGDLVTETDKKVENVVVHKLLEVFPSHDFIGEENTAAGRKNVLTDKPTWIIDPIDGTNNFVHRFPFVCISVALLIEKQPVIGIIYNPISNEYYHAIKGRGAFCNGKQIHVKKTEELKDALLCTEFGSSRDKDVLDTKLGNMRKIIDYVHGIRTLGSAALHMCLVAKACSDAYYSFGIHIWDFAAGYLIVQEAGGCVIDTTGGEVDLMSRRILCAGTPQLAQAVSKMLKQIELERD